MKKIIIFFSSTLYIFFLSSCSHSCPKEELEPIIDQYVKYWNTGEFVNIDKILHPEFELRMTPKYEAEKGIDLFKKNVIKWRTAYPDFHIVVKEKFCTNKEAAGIWEITATNTGEGSHPPTGKSIRITGMSIFHFLDGKIKDDWIDSNNLYWLSQLGFELKPPSE